MCFVLVHFAHHPSSIDSRWFARKPASQALVAYTCHSLRLAIALYRSSYCSGPVLIAFPRHIGFIWAFPRPSQPPVVNCRRFAPARHQAIVAYTTSRIPCYIPCYIPCCTIAIPCPYRSTVLYTVRTAVLLLSIAVVRI